MGLFKFTNATATVVFTGAFGEPPEESDVTPTESRTILNECVTAFLLSLSAAVVNFWGGFRYVSDTVKIKDYYLCT